MMKSSSLSILFLLSLILALGFLNIVLSCALYNTYYPLYVILVFLIAPIPNSLTTCILQSNSYYNNNNNMGYSDIDDYDPILTFQSLMKFLTGMLVSSGTFLPIVFWRCELIPTGSFLLSLTGGFLVYLSFALFGMGFTLKEENDYDF